MNTITAKGKSRFAGKLASICTIGCANRARRGLMPMVTPTGTQMSEETTTTMMTRAKVTAPRPITYGNVRNPTSRPI